MLRLLLVLLAIPHLTYAEDMALAQDPDWIDEAAIPALPDELRDQAVNGSFDLISDTQIVWEGSERLTWWRHVITPFDRAGLDAVGTLTYVFDPYYADVSLTRLNLIRDGQIIDLKDRVKIDLYQRELGLEDGIVDGTLTAVIEVPGIRVGDLLDYAILSREKGILPGDEYSVSADLEWGVPIALSRLRLRWPNLQTLQLGPLPAHVETTSIKADGATIYDFAIQNAPPVVEEDMSAPGTWKAAWLQVGAWTSWQPISDGFAPYYLADYPLTPAWEARLTQLRQDTNDPEKQAMAALRMVQDEIRYVGVEVGEGGYFARKPADVIGNGYGDCKDKALLLRILLDRLGIEAQVVLADIDGWLRGDEVPSLYVFDHMILRARINGAWVYMDPTASHQGGDLSHAVTPDYGYVLPISGEVGQQLDLIRLGDKDAFASDITETYSFNFAGVFLTVESDFRGNAADYWRYNWASGSKVDLADSFTGYYSENYPGIRQVAEPTFADDPLSNKVTLVERYFLPQSDFSAPDLIENFLFQSDDFAKYFIDPVEKRELPMWLGLRRDQSWKVVVNDAPIDFDAPDSMTIENAAFRYDFSGRDTEGGGMVLQWHYQTKERLIAPDLVPSVLEDAKAMTDYQSWTWDLTVEDN